MKSLRNDNQAGSALLELAIVVPFVLLLSLMGLELGQGLEVHQKMNTLSKELANAIFRDCSPTGAKLGRSARASLQSCVQRSVEELAPQAQNVLPGVILIGSVYRKLAPGSGLGIRSFRRAAITSSTGNTREGRAERLEVQRALNDFWVPNVLPYPRVVAVGQVYYAYEPMVPIYSMFSPDRKLYSVTIF